MDRHIASSCLGEVAMVRRYRLSGDGFAVLYCVIMGLFIAWPDEFARLRALWFQALTVLASGVTLSI
jgi:hypothetical protein